MISSAIREIKVVMITTLTATILIIVMITIIVREPMVIMITTIVATILILI